MSSDVDQDIADAFSGKDTHAEDSNVDSDIAAAFKDSSSATKPAKESPGFLTQMSYLAKDAVGGLAKSAGTMQDVGTNLGSVLYGKTHGDPDIAPPIRYGAPGSMGDTLSKPFQHDPYGEGTTDPKEAIRQALPKLGDQPAVKKIMDSPAAQTLAQDVVPPVQAAGNIIGTAASVGSMAEHLRSAPKPEYQDPQNMGAAHAAPDFSTAEPDVQAEVAKLTPQQIEQNRPVLERHAEAQSLPVKIRLTAGQATQDPDIISNEMNKRGATGLSKTLAEQGQNLKDNLQAIRENVGPDVFSTNAVEHGDTLIEAYKAKDAPVLADIDNKYQALRDAAGGDLPIDGPKFVENAKGALRKQLLTNDVPTSVAADLKDFESGTPMNFEDFESMRTKLAREMRDNPNGNQRAAAGIVRQSLEDLPLQPGAEALKPLADQARSAARARFEAMKADPAYDAAVNDKVAPDQFVNKFITGKGATRDNVAKMRQSLSDNPAAVQTMGVATVDELKKAAGITPMGEGRFGQSRYNSRLEDLRPKLGSLLPPEAADHATTLGKVARYIKEAPEGETINRSNTLSGAIAQGAGHVAKSVLNVSTRGVAGPVIDFAQAKLGERALRKELETATAPLAGVSSGSNGPPSP